MKAGKRETEEAEAGLKAAPGYHPQATEWIRVVCCGGMSGSCDQIWAPKGPALCLSFLLMSSQLALPASVVRVAGRVQSRAQVSAEYPLELNTGFCSEGTDCSSFTKP